jgi:hypothetical protein
MNLLARWVAESGGNWMLRLVLVVALFTATALALSYATLALG